MSFLAAISSIRTLLRSTRSPWQRLSETLIEDLARVDTQILHPDGELGRERAHIASASVSWRDKIKFLDGGLVLRPNTLGRKTEKEGGGLGLSSRKHRDNINWQHALVARPMIICSITRIIRYKKHSQKYRNFKQQTIACQK